MRKFKVVLYSIYFLFLVASLLFALFTEKMFDQFGMLKFLRFLETWAVIGMVLFALEWVIENLHIKRLKSRNIKLEKEKEALKVRLFDMEEEKREKNKSLKTSGDTLEKKPDPDFDDPNDTKNK